MVKEYKISQAEDMFPPFTLKVLKNKVIECSDESHPYGCNWDSLKAYYQTRPYKCNIEEIGNLQTVSE
jgi:hypothetical protein